MSSKFHTISFVTKVEISNVNVPGRTSKVDAEKYEASALDREGVFRLAVGLTARSYERLLGPRPARPSTR
ncbi:MAG: DUF6194 family protein [Actinomycetota bacterium]